MKKLLIGLVILFCTLVAIADDDIKLLCDVTVDSSGSDYVVKRATEQLQVNIGYYMDGVTAITANGVNVSFDISNKKRTLYSIVDRNTDYSNSKKFEMHFYLSPNPDDKAKQILLIEDIVIDRNTGRIFYKKLENGDVNGMKYLTAVTLNGSCKKVDLKKVLF